MLKVDENGTWDVQEGNGCINRILIEPAIGYEPEPILEQPISLEERIEALQNAFNEFLGVV